MANKNQKNATIGDTVLTKIGENALLNCDESVAEVFVTANGRVFTSENEAALLASSLSDKSVIKVKRKTNKNE